MVMPAFDIVPGLRFVTREAWGADMGLPRLGNTVARSARTHIFAHHTVMVDSDATPNIWESEAEVFAMMRKIQTVRPDLGKDVPYNFVIFLTTMNDGIYVCEGRGEDRAGAHTKGHNTKAIATSFAGDFENRLIAPQEIADRMVPYATFLRWLKTSASHPTYGEFEPLSNLGKLKPAGRHIFFHRDVKNTDCPGAKLETHLRLVRF
jgi:peptidoglycan recognition protein